MRILLAIPFIALLAPRLDACSCSTPGTPCHAAGIAAAAFTGTVLNMTWNPVQPFQVDGLRAGQRGLSASRVADPMRPIPRAFYVVRIQVAEVLSGIAPGQKEIEVVTGGGGGDCGYPFQAGMDYVVYAFKNAEGRLETTICSRTRPLAQAAEDLRYFQTMAGAPATGELLVRTDYAGMPGKPGVSIVVDGQGSRHTAKTDGAGNAKFTDLPPGEYAIHEEADGDLPDDPRVQLYAKGCRELTLTRALRITGRIMTKQGELASRVGVQIRPTQDAGGSGAWTFRGVTDSDGRYEINIIRPGQYYLGINLNNTATTDAPYPRWFYPGTEVQALASIIEFFGKPDSATYNFTLPDRQNPRTIEGIVLTSDGRPRPRTSVSVVDSFDAVIATGVTDDSGRFLLRVFAQIPYRLYAIFAGDSPGAAVSALPTDIQPGPRPLSLRLILTEPGNLFFGSGRKGPGEQR